MNKRPLTDMHEIAKKEVENQMRSFTVANMEGQERLCRKLDKLETLVKRQYKSRHDLLQDLALVVLFILMFVMRSCT